MLETSAIAANRIRREATADMDLIFRRATGAAATRHSLIMFSIPTAEGKSWIWREKTAQDYDTTRFFVLSRYNISQLTD
jgi:hypothetical protein